MVVVMLYHFHDSRSVEPRVYRCWNQVPSIWQYSPIVMTMIKNSPIVIVSVMRVGGWSITFIVTIIPSIWGPGGPAAIRGGGLPPPLPLLLAGWQLLLPPFPFQGGRGSLPSGQQCEEQLEFPSPSPPSSPGAPGALAVHNVDWYIYFISSNTSPFGPKVIPWLLKFDAPHSNMSPFRIFWYTVRSRRLSARLIRSASVIGRMSVGICVSTSFFGYSALGTSSCCEFMPAYPKKAGIGILHSHIAAVHHCS